MDFGLCTLIPPPLSSQCLTAPPCQRHGLLPHSLMPTLPNPSYGTFFLLPFSIWKSRSTSTFPSPSYLTSWTPSAHWASPSYAPFSLPNLSQIKKQLGSFSTNPSDYPLLFPQPIPDIRKELKKLRRVPKLLYEIW